MKRAVLIGLVVLLVVSGCAAPIVPSQVDYSDLNTTQIDIPAWVFEIDWVKGPKALEKVEGVVNATQNPDGSVLLTITKAGHLKLLEDVNRSMTREFGAILLSQVMPYIESIGCTNGYEYLTLTVDREGYQKDLMKLAPRVVGINHSVFIRYLQVER